ncbi:MAG: EamA family transporter [Bryobacteraceae bacterium]
MNFRREHLLRTYLLVLLFVALRSFGNLALAWGTKRLPQTLSVHASAYLWSMLDPFVAAGIVLLILSLFTRMALLSVADLSFVLPTTAVGYPLAAVLGWFFLREQVSPAHWIATLLIFAGTALVGTTPRSTTSVGPPGAESAE